MKKIIITIVSILLIVLVAILIMSKLGNSKPNANIKSAENVLYINYGAANISKTNVYYGEEVYYISYYTKDNNDYIGVMDKDYNLTMNVEKSSLKQIDEIKNQNYTVGYKYEKLIYGIKKENKDGYTYSYYDALTGEFIKKINMDR